MPPSLPGCLTRSMSSDGSRSRPPRIFVPNPSLLSPVGQWSPRLPTKNPPHRRIPLEHRDTDPPESTIALVVPPPPNAVFESLSPKSPWIEEHELIDTLNNDDANSEAAQWVEEHEVIDTLDDDDADSDIIMADDFTALDLSDSGFNCIPIGLFAEADVFMQIRTLNLSKNPFDASLDKYITETLILPHLTSLYLRSCNLSHIDPLVRHLRAPNLKELDISRHQFTGSVPRFRQHFPALERLVANKGGFEWVEESVVEGLQLLELKKNFVKDHDGRLRSLCARQGARILL